MNHNVFEQTVFLSRAISMMGRFLKDAVARQLEAVRIARAGCALLMTGVSSTSPLFTAAADWIMTRQRPDGGWADTDETIWSVGLLRALYGPDFGAVSAAYKWLGTQRQANGGWGRHARDMARIPTTALIISLAPEVARPLDVDWLAREWMRDFEGVVRLSYKAGFFLLSAVNGQYGDLVSSTIAHLITDQNTDGGFGPWRNHPIGSDPWSTGVVLWGLARWKQQVGPSIFTNMLSWLEHNQLDSGYWPYHYLDDGTALALIGGMAAIRALMTGE